MVLNGGGLDMVVLVEIMDVAAIGLENVANAVDV
jgi:hypothetical protein